MPVLLLARGDKEGRELLRKALQARYGLGAPAIETLILHLDGRARTRVGPLTTWTSTSTTAYFAFPGSARWDTTFRAIGVTLQSSAHAYDGSTYRHRNGRDPVVTAENPAHAQSARRWLATAAAMLLTPLAEQFIELKATGERSFDATNLDTGDTLSVSLHEDYTVDTISSRCLNPSQGHAEQLLTFKALDGLTSISDLMLPAKVAIQWGGDTKYEVTPVAVKINPSIDAAIFRLEDTP